MAAALSTVLLLAACGDDDKDAFIATPQPDEVLQLRGFDITAANFRETVRSRYIEGDPAFCESIDGFTPQEAIDALNAYLQEARGNVPIPNATPISDEAQRSIDDELRAARITLDECEAVASPTDGT